ncbi:tRNA lysidine(34) synthetase TilS [bacterium]|nr:tRNA lysidine(34) synthetase TilS [bacterium]
MADKLNITLGAAHLNHGIRPESKDEQSLVAKYCEKLNIPLITALRDVPAAATREGKGLEETARILRYEFLEHSAEEFKASLVSLGHNTDDQAETVLHHIIRGSGLRGLMGIPAKRGIFIRPILCCKGEELVRFLKNRKIKYATDKSNMENNYLRNKIRNTLLPMLRNEFNPNIDNTLVRLGNNISEWWEATGKRIENILEEYEDNNNFNIPLDKLDGLGDFEIYLLIDIALKTHLGIFQDIEKCHFDAAKALLHSGQSGKSINFPHGITISLEQTSLRLTKKSANKSYSPPEITLPSTGKYNLPSWNMSVKIEQLPFNEDLSFLSSEDEIYMASVDFPIKIRGRKPGDRINPFGMKGRKKLSDIMIDKKVPLYKRDQIPIIEDKKGIIWVPGVATDEKTRILKKTKQITRIKLIRDN